MLGLCSLQAASQSQLVREGPVQGAGVGLARERGLGSPLCNPSALPS